MTNTKWEDPSIEGSEPQLNNGCGKGTGSNNGCGGGTGANHGCGPGSPTSTKKGERDASGFTPPEMFDTSQKAVPGNTCTEGGGNANTCNRGGGHTNDCGDGSD